MTGDLIDTHCHIDAYPDPANVLASAAAAGVQVVAVTNTPDAYNRLATLLPRSGPAQPALGLHPLHAAPTRHDRRAPRVEQAGRTGRMDRRDEPRLHPQAEARVMQLAVFEALLALPQLRDRPVTVHSRAAERETIQRLADARVRAVLHWYTGPLTVADDALAAGLSFSVNPAMVASAKGRALVRATHEPGPPRNQQDLSPAWRADPARQQAPGPRRRPRPPMEGHARIRARHDRR